MAGMDVSFICLNDCVTRLSQLTDHAKVSDPVEDYILSLHQHVLIHSTACVCKLHMKEIFAKTTLAASVTNTLFKLCSDVIKGWENLLQGVHAGDGPPYNTLVKVIYWHFRRRWRWLLWLLLLVLCLLLLFHNFLSGRSANASECCSPVLYTVQWQFHSRLLFLHAELVHAFNNSSCIVTASPYKPRHFTCA